MSRRQEIVDILMARLKSISIAHGDSHDLVRVEEWAVAKCSERDMPCLVLRDTGSNVNNAMSGSASNSLEVEIDVLVSEKDTTMSALRNIMSDVLKAVGYEDDDLPEYRTFNGDEVLAEHQDKFYGGTRMKFAVVYDSLEWEI